MNRGFASIALIIGLVVIVLGALGYIVFMKKPSVLTAVPTSDRSNFLYVNGGGPYYYDSEGKYSIRILNGKLIKYVTTEITILEDRNAKLPSSDPKLFIYDVTKNEGREVSFGEAEKLNLDSNRESPDGLGVILDKGSVYLAVRGTDYQSAKIVKKLNIQLSESFNNFRFLGWIE